MGLLDSLTGASDAAMMSNPETAILSTVSKHPGKFMMIPLLWAAMICIMLAAGFAVFGKGMAKPAFFGFLALLLGGGAVYGIMKG